MVDDEYLDELLKYDFRSFKKGRGPGSVLLHDMHSQYLKRQKTKAQKEEEKGGHYQQIESNTFNSV